MSTAAPITLEANMTITIAGPALVVVSPPVPTGAAPGYDPKMDPQLALLREHLHMLGYELTVTPREDGKPTTQGRFPEPKPRREGPATGSIVP
jgi:hypothetical protein